MSVIKVSIVTVVYNEVKHIEQAIQSIINQTYPHIEYIVIDGASTDGTLAIIDKYTDRITHLVSEPDSGIYAAMNKGIRLCSGQLIGILNSNDWYETDAIENIVKAYTNNPDIDVFHGLLKYYDLNDQDDSVSGHFPTYLKEGMIEHPTCFLKKDVYERIGLYDEHYQSASDYDFMLKVWKNNLKFYFLPIILTNYRKGGMSFSFKSALETVQIQRKFKLISGFKRFALTFYYYLKIKRNWKLLS